MRVDTLLSRPDTTKLDTIRPVPAQPTPIDSIKRPLARAELPVLTDLGGDYAWDRAAFFATGALTLLDLLERIPGVTALRAAWLVSPQANAYLGNVRRLRMFYDGVELESLDPAGGGIEDLTTIPLWTLEEVRVERGADELRVHIRSWRVDRTSAYTRTDVATGSEETNLYRAFYGRRFDHGEALQVAAQQFSSRSTRAPTSGDQLTLFLRTGIASARGSVDGMLIRSTPTRDPLQNGYGYTIPGNGTTRTLAFVRAARGDPEAGPWLQLTASTQQFRNTPLASASGGGAASASASTEIRRAHAQWIAAGGYAVGNFGLSVVGRLRTVEGTSWASVPGLGQPPATTRNAVVFAPSARVHWTPSRITLAAFAERTPSDSSNRLEASARLSLLPFLAVAATVTHRSRSPAPEGGGAEQSARAEAGIRLARLWVSGGALRRDATLLAPPTLFDSAYVPVAEPIATGGFAAIHGPLVGPFSADAIGIRWSSAGVYRPAYQARSELSVASAWVSRFPSGNFHFLGALQHEYRTSTYAPVAGGLRSTGPSSVLSSLVEIRIVSATLSWQYRNIVGFPYQFVPGYELPRQLSVYGVRWDFWN
ncbi:MAG: hypothetical protein NVS4B3_11640 [Gemmatimonadaceae bacterium]